MAAVLAARAKGEEDRQLTSFLLLVALAFQAEPAGMGMLSGDRRATLELERRARRILERIAPDFDRSPEEMLTALSGLTGVFSSTGIDLQSTHARAPRLLEQLSQLRQDLLDWIQDHGDDVHIDLADMVAGLADVAIRGTTVLLQRTWVMTDDMAGLLRAWSRPPAGSPHRRCDRNGCSTAGSKCACCGAPERRRSSGAPC